MNRLLLILLFCCAGSAMAEDLCPLAVGNNWKGWVKVKIIKVNGTAKVMQLSGEDYLVEGSVPDLGVHDTYQGRCKDSQIYGKKLKTPVKLQRKGNILFVDHAQDGGVAHFERRLDEFSIWQLLRW